MYLIGSQALAINGISRNPKDIDLVCARQEYEDFIRNNDVVFASESKQYPGKFTVRIKGIDKKIEIDATDSSSNFLIKQTNHKRLYFIGNTPCKVANINVCYLTKRSHANFDVNFSKTFADLISIQKRNELDFTPDEIAYFEARRAEATERYGNKQKRINLNKKNEEFFMGGKELRSYEHDWLHAMIAFTPGEPMYERCKYDLSLAKIDKELFGFLDLHDKLTMVQEEAMVIGLERFYIPGKFKTGRFVYREGLLKLTRDLCKGWFQDFILDNAALLTEPMWDFVARFEEAKKDLKNEMYV